MEHLLLLFVGAALVNNIVLSRFLGICPFMGVSKSTETAVGMSLSVAFVMTISSAVSFLIDKYILVPLSLEYLRTIVFILIIASLVQFVEMVIEKTLPELYSGLGIYLPLITTNCAVLGVALLNVQFQYNFIEMLIFSFGTAAGFGLALILFAGLRERIAYSTVPKYFQGMPIVFIMAGILSLAFMGFSGMVK
ncbi:MAG: electron transport complex subunit RsxA [Mucispirillum sp.]|uniref:Ion-translocating oxidoreductase complex subunit A n=1 Tax=Candidatus Mucispirillum faecigallinarum TaxID=2838699 RepID=A0A9D2GSW2_9BACT|nr:electron transport complex subunit RsxA [Mucispirillum sp.]HIZ89382.1 electron transport complex subunit RsxA [Candidatus Mucispirillum faecigallinarum]